MVEKKTEMRNLIESAVLLAKKNDVPFKEIEELVKFFYFDDATSSEDDLLIFREKSKKVVTEMDVGSRFWLTVNLLCIAYDSKDYNRKSLAKRLAKTMGREDINMYNTIGTIMFKFSLYIRTKSLSPSYRGYPARISTYETLNILVPYIDNL